MNSQICKHKSVPANVTNAPLRTFCQEERVKCEGAPLAHQVPCSAVWRAGTARFCATCSTPAHPLCDRSSAPKETQLLNSPEVADLRNRILTQQTFNISTLMPQQCYLRSHPRPLLLLRFLPALHRETVSFLCWLPSNWPKLLQGNQQKEQPKSYNSSAVAAELCSKYIYNFPPNLLESCMLAVRARLSQAKLLGAVRDICFCCTV